MAFEFSVRQTNAGLEVYFQARGLSFSSEKPLSFSEEKPIPIQDHRTRMIQELAIRTQHHLDFCQSLSMRTDHELDYLLKVVTAQTPDYVLDHYSETPNLTPQTHNVLNMDLTLYDLGGGW